MATRTRFWARRSRNKTTLDERACSLHQPNGRAEGNQRFRSIVSVFAEFPPVWDGPNRFGLSADEWGRVTLPQILTKDAAQAVIRARALDADAEAKKYTQILYVRLRPSTTVQYAIRLHAEHGVVLLQLLNESYVEMTKSWICNVRRFGTVLPKTLFVTTDQAAYDALTAFDTTLNVVLEPYIAPKSMKYGQTTYYNYMLFRTKLISTLLDSNLSLWLTESDAVWLKDPTDLVMGTEGDLVTMSDDRPPRKLLQGGFQLLRPTDATKRLWTRMRDAFETRMKAVSKQYIGDHGSEQLMLDKMIREDSELRVGWLDPHTFVPGLWYKDTSYRNTDAAVVLNNLIIGNEAKIKRAKKWKHWFLDQQGACCSVCA